MRQWYFHKWEEASFELPLQYLNNVYETYIHCETLLMFIAVTVLKNVKAFNIFHFLIR